ncbi:MAG: hypothetical protein ACP5OG_02780 [Candidatus Nanoarchaeia archaeon]
MKAVVFIQDIVGIENVGPVIVGRINEGILQQGMCITIEGQEYEVTSMEVGRIKVSEAKFGDSVAFTLNTKNSALLKKILRKSNIFSEKKFQLPPKPRPEEIEPIAEEEPKKGFFSRLFKKDL